jgi:putative ABC transport system substrate-binding protein
MLLFSSRQSVPLLELSDRQADKGALLVFTFIAEDIGRQAGELALAVLSGRPPADLPYTIARKFSLIVNLKIAHKLNLIIPQDILDRATNVIQ